jgi:hypothetical protein
MVIVNGMSLITSGPISLWARAIYDSSPPRFPRCTKAHTFFASVLFSVYYVLIQSKEECTSVFFSRYEDDDVAAVFRHDVVLIRRKQRIELWRGCQVGFETAWK